MAINIGSVTVDIVPDLTRFNARMREATRAMSVDLNIRPNLDQSAMARVRAEVNRTDAGNVKVGIDQKALAGSIAAGIRQASAMTGLGALNGVVNGSVGASLKASLGGALVSITAAASQAGGAIALLPAGIAALAAPIAAVKIGTQGLSDAFKALASGDAAKLQQAMAGLSPAARDLVTQVGSLQKSWHGLQLDVQQHLLQGVGKSFHDLATTALPVLRQGLDGIASGLNSGIKPLFAALQTQGPQFRTLFANIGTAVGTVAKALTPLVTGFVQLASVGSQFLPEFAQGFANVAQKFGDWVKQASASGQLVTIIRNAGEALHELGTIVGNVLGIFGGLFKPAMDDGQQLLLLLGNLTGNLKTMINSVASQKALTGFFDSVLSVANTLAPVVEQLGQVLIQNVLPALGQLAQAVAPIIAQLGTQLVGVIKVLTDSMPSLTTTVADLFNAFSPLVSVIGDILSAALPPLLQALDMLAPAIGAVSSVLGGALLDAVKAIAPALPGLASSLANIVQTFAQAAGPVLGFATSVLPPLLSVLQGILSVADKLGPVLPVLVGGFLAFKAVGAISGALSTFAKSLETAAINAGVATEKLTGSATAGERVMTGLGKASTGVSALGTALPVVGVVVAAFTTVMEHNSEVSDRWAQAIAAGGQAAVTAQRQMADFKTANEQVNSGASGWITGLVGLNTGYGLTAKAISDAKDKAKDLQAQMTPLQREQQAVTDAANAYADAIDRSGPGSDAARAALARYQQATADQKTTQDGLNQAEQTHLQALQQIANQQLSSVNAGLAAQQAQLQFKDAVDQLNKGMADGSLKGNALQEAQLGLAQSAIQAATQAGAQAAAQAKANGVTDTAQASNAAMLQSLQQNEQFLSGPAKAAVDQQIAVLQQATVATNNVGDATGKMGLDVVRNYDASTQIVANATDAQIKDLEALGFTVTHLPDHTIAVSANTQAARDAITDLTNDYRQYSINVGLGGFSAKAAASGGLMQGPGSGTSDSILARVSHGEFVVNAAATARNLPLLRAINGPGQPRDVPAFASGGLVGGDWSLMAKVGILPSAIASAMAAIKQFVTAAASFRVGGGAAQWSGVVQQVIGLLGLPGAALGGILNIIQHESGGNPNAINLTDSNARAGHPSQGLMQTIPGTFAAYAGPFIGRGITDPLANIYAGSNYALHRYGVGFLTGGGNTNSVGRYIGYDAGGTVPVGPSLHYNGTGHPEIIAPAQTFQQAMAGLGGRGPLMHVEHQYVNDGVDMDLLLQQAEFRQRAGAFSD